MLRPGGAFVAWDYCNYRAVNVFPERPAIRRLFQAYFESSEQSGGSYDIGNRLPGLLIGLGFELDAVVPIQRLSRPDGMAWKWVSSFHRNYVPKLAESGLLTEEEADECLDAWAAAGQDAGSFLFTPPMIGIVARKPR